MEELKEKLAKFVGFKRRCRGVVVVNHDWIETPQGGHLCIGQLPDFPNDPSACFEWLIPDHDIVSVEFKYSADDVRCWITLASDNRVQGSAPMGQEALALCRAYEKLVDGEGL